MKQRLVRLLVAGACAYSAALLALAALWAVLPRYPWWLALANLFAVWLFVPLLALAPAALVVRSRPLRGASALMLAVFLATFGGALAPRPAPPPEGAAAQLRVVTFNHFVANRRVRDVVALIRAQNADVVALQELSEPVARAIQVDLAAEYPHQLLVPDRRAIGLGIISRHPLESTSVAASFRGLQATLLFQGRSIRLINVHPSVPFVYTGREGPLGLLDALQTFDTGRRPAQLDALVAQIDATNGPLIVLGDFNLGDREVFYQAFDARLHDAYRETSTGFGFTFPNNARVNRVPVPLPLVRIDYVWSRSGITPLASRVECANVGSDHCMLVADLQVGPPESAESPTPPRPARS